MAVTAGLFSSTSLSLNPVNLYEIRDASTGAVQARLSEVARVGSPRGGLLNPDRVRTPRLTFAVSAPDGTVLMYADRAEHRERNLVAPQTAFVGTDGTVLGRIVHSAGGGRPVGTTEQGLLLVPGARVLGPDLRPLADLVYEQPPDLERPTLPDRAIRWVTPDGVRLAERRDGDLLIDPGVTGVWRALIIGSYLAVAFEFHLPIGHGPASGAVPEPYPGYADVHAGRRDIAAPPGAPRRGLGWTLMGAGWAVFAAAVLTALLASPGIPSVTELGRSGLLWMLLPVAAAAGALTLFGSRALAKGPWNAFHVFVPLLCVGGFFATLAASSQAVFAATGDKAACTVEGEVYRPLPQKGGITGWYKVTCPNRTHVLPLHRDDPERRAGERVEVVTDPDGKFDPVFADTVGPSDAAPMALIPIALVAVPPLAVAFGPRLRRRRGRFLPTPGR